LIFNKFKLNEGSKLFVFSADKLSLIGSFTSENNKANGWFSTIPVAGDDIIVELDVTSGGQFDEINISGIAHDYKNAFGLKTGFRASESCNVNINCPEGADWQIEKRAVVKFSYGTLGSLYFCTGVLINNTAYDKKPYLLTAEHCVSSQATANTTIFMFNYETASCTAFVEPSFKSISTAKLIATGVSLDFSLLQLNENPPASYNVYFAGWNRSTIPAKNTVTIHHPQGDVKKISKDNEAPVIANYGSGYASNSHWNILRWDLGTTEAGSSGSPLFDQNHSIVGSLTGGDANCSNNVNDYYSRFDKAWNMNTSANQQLKAWLDPGNTGVEVLDGLDPNSPSLGVDIAVIKIIQPINAVCINNQITPEVTFQNKGIINLTSATISYKLSDGTTASIAWTGVLKSLETAIVKFNPITSPSGNVTFKAYTSAPNGISDSNRTNDTLQSYYVGDKPISEVIIKGDLEICGEFLEGDYTNDILGNYKWEVEGGSILGKDTTKKISVRWDDWGGRFIKLNVTNLCNSFNAEPVKIKVVEQSLHLEISTGSNGESVCWLLEDCDGNIVYEKCDLLANQSYVENLCVTKGCYQFKIISQSSGIKNYKLLNSLNDEIIAEGNLIGQNINEQFTINTSSNQASFNVYPNPARDEIVIEASFSELYNDTKFAIYNTSGSSVVPYNLLDERKTIDITNLPNGLYFLEIISPYGKFSKKIVKP